MDAPADQPDRAVEAFDRAAEADLLPRLQVCLHSQEWVDAVLAGRPYGEAAVLEVAATDAAHALSDQGLGEALAAHPRIGERPTDATAASAHSRREQAGVGTDGSTAQRLREANLAYEARFGQVLLVRAAGRSAEDVLALATARLGNDEATEQRVVREQLGEIAVLRLRSLLDELTATTGARA